MQKKLYKIQGIEFTQGVLTPKQQIDILSIFDNENVVIGLLNNVSNYFAKLSEQDKMKAKHLADAMSKDDKSITWEDLYDGASENVVNLIKEIVLPAITQIGTGCEDLFFDWASIVLSCDNKEFYHKESKHPLIATTNHINKNYDVWLPFLKASLTDEDAGEIIDDFFTLNKGSHFTKRILGLVKSLGIIDQVKSLMPNSETMKANG